MAMSSKPELCGPSSMCGSIGEGASYVSFFDSGVLGPGPYLSPAWRAMRSGPETPKEKGFRDKVELLLWCDHDHPSQEEGEKCESKQ